MRFNVVVVVVVVVVVLESLQPQNVLMMFLFLVKHSHLLTVNTRPDFNSSLISTWYERATVDNFLHVRRTSSSTKLMQYVYVTSFFCK